MWILKNTICVHVPQAMILAGFLKSGVASKTVRQAVRRQRQQKQNNAHTGRPAPTNGFVLISNKSSLLVLTVIADPTKWRKPKPLLFVDCYVPHHCCPPPPLWSLSLSSLLLSLLCSSSSLLLSSLLLSSLIAHVIGQQQRLCLCQLCWWDGLCHAPSPLPSYPSCLASLTCCSSSRPHSLSSPSLADCYFLFPPALSMTPASSHSSPCHHLPLPPSLPPLPLHCPPHPLAPTGCHHHWLIVIFLMAGRARATILPLLLLGFCRARPPLCHLCPLTSPP